MAQKLFTIKVFYINPNKHFSVWHNCNTTGINKLKADTKLSIAYIQGFKPNTQNSKPLFTIYIEDIFCVSIFFKDNRPPHKEYGLTRIQLEWCKTNAKNNGASGINIYNLKEQKFIETIYF